MNARETDRESKRGYVMLCYVLFIGNKNVTRKNEHTNANIKKIKYKKYYLHICS